MSFIPKQIETKGSVKLVNNNYEIIMASFTDHVYIKVTNLINYSAYESTIHSYDSTHSCVKTLKNLWNIFVKAFEMINKYEVNILNPDMDELYNEYVILKLLEQHNNIVLTIYYNLVISFEFNITLNKIKSEGLIMDITKIKYDFKQITKLQAKVGGLETKVDELENKLNIVFSCLSKIHVHGHQIDSTVLTLNITKDVDISVYFNLKELITISYYVDLTIIPNSNTLEVLINHGKSYTSNYIQYNGFNFINISQLPKLKCLQFQHCDYLLNNTNLLLDQLKAHPNKTNIELIFINSSYFKDTIEIYKLIGLKSVTIL